MQQSIRCENCATVKLEWHKGRRSSVFIVDCEHMSNFVLIVDFEQANVSWVHIEKANIFEDKIEYIMRCVITF